MIILLSSLIFTLLPYLKGYAFSDGGDNLTHLGFARAIVTTGYFGMDEVYPVTHILIAQLSLITGIELEKLVNFIGPLFYLLFVAFTYLFSREILSKPAAILATTASTFLSCYYYSEIFPMGFALTFFPLIFYLYFHNQKVQSVKFTTLLIILVVMMVFFHPVASFALTGALLLMESGRVIYEKLLVKEKAPVFFSSSLLMISFYVLVFWMWQRFYVWDSTIASIAGWFNSELFTQPMTAVAQDAFSKLGLNLIGQILVVFKEYGPILIMFGLSMITILLMIRKMITSKSSINAQVLAYSCFFLPAAAIWLIDYVRPLTELTSGRMIWVMAAILPLLSGVSLKVLGGFPPESDLKMKKRHFTSVRLAGIGLIIAASSLLAVFGLYPSPYRYFPFGGISQAAFTGEVWIVQNGSPEKAVITLYNPRTSRIARCSLGNRANGPPRAKDETEIDYHFGYTSHQTMGQASLDDKYLFLTAANRLLYTEVWPQVDRLNSNDFVRLENDPTVSRLYSNGEAQNYYITAKGDSGLT